MEEKGSKVDPAKINRGSHLKQIKTTVEFPEDGRTLFTIHSERWFSGDEFLEKPGHLFGLAVLAIVVLGIGLPFLIQLAIAFI